MSKRSIIHPRVAGFIVVLTACMAVVAGGASSAFAAVPAPAWRITITPGPTHFTPGDETGTDKYQVTAVNVGGVATDGSPVTLTDTLPAGVTLDPSEAKGEDDEVNALACTQGTPVTCTDEASITPGKAVGMTIPVDVSPGAEPSVLDRATVSGGGALPVTASANTVVSPLPATFGFQSFHTWFANTDGAAAMQAGSHPYSVTFRFTVNDIVTSVGHMPGAGDPKTVIANLPAGLTINPTATSVRCAETQLETDKEASTGGGCPAASQVGTIRSTPGFLPGSPSDVTYNEPLYNMVPPPGSPAELGFDAVGVGIYVHLLGGLRPGDYGITSTTKDILQKGMITAVEVTLWGNPSDPSHNDQRGECVSSSKYQCPSPPGVEARGVPFVTLPGACSGPLRTGLTSDSWQEPGRFLPEDIAESSTREGGLVGIEGCQKLGFSPAVSVRPSEPAVPVAGSASGLELDLKVPQAESVEGLAESDVKDVVVSLPAGVSVSPSAANGLAACAPSEVQLGAEGLVGSCPDASKVGTAEVLTPLLEKPLQGGLYVAQQGNAGPGQGSNPFNSLLAVYLVVEGSGVRIKLAGHVEPDPTTGQLTVRFEGNPGQEGEPQLPFSDLKVKMYGGPRAVLAMGSACGTYEANTVLTPWDGNPSVSRGSSFNVTSGCAGGFAPSFTAGSASNQAGGYSPVSLSFSRQSDGEQDFKGLEATLPPGLSAKLAGIPLCGDTEASAGSCSEASRIGTVTVGAGPGPDPYYVQGKVYLTGPYNGGPFGEVVEVPAVAGPFNLGLVVVRGSIRINPTTAQATVVSDPFPSILQGIPLQVKTVNVALDRSGFTFNPTNCTPSSVTATLSSTTGANANVSSPFEAANCASLPFKPSLTASTLGKASKVGGASLTVKVVPGAGQANIAKVDLELPKQLPSRLSTLQKACTEAQFDANVAGCPVGSNIGMAKAVTPVLAGPLVGPAYLVSHGGAAFPDVEFVLQGEGVTIVLDGKTQIKNGLTYSHFETVPDAPITSFETVLPEGPHSILATNLPATAKYNLCGTALSIPTTITGQNGAVVTQTTKIGVSGCAKAKALTTAQKLAAALKACKKKAKGKQAACEQAARKRYPSAKRKKTKKTK